MSLSVAHLGPAGTYAESAALAYAVQLKEQTGEEVVLLPCSSIVQTLRTVASHQSNFAVVPVENSIEGSVTVTLDTLWQLDLLRVQQAFVLPIAHALLSCATDRHRVQTVYSHPQALAQCQGWLEQFLPNAQLVAARSTTEALRSLPDDQTVAAIASHRAATLYQLPVLAYPINDHPDNCTRFWVLSLQPDPIGNHTSLAFSLPANMPGALVKPLQIFAERGINLSRIESRPTKRSLGEYLFFVDIESSSQTSAMQSALSELTACTETLKVFGSYDVSVVESNSASSTL
jgi:prephenate dehydratase